MNQKKKIENYQQIAMGTGLRYDETNDLFHGERDGFDFIVYAPDARLSIYDGAAYGGKKRWRVDIWQAGSERVSEKQQEDREFWSEESGYQSITEGTVQCGKM